jgi:hypothetical protein
MVQKRRYVAMSGTFFSFLGRPAARGAGLVLREIVVGLICLDFEAAQAWSELAIFRAGVLLSCCLVA